MENIGSDNLLKIIVYLNPSEIINLSLINKYHHNILAIANSVVWKQYFHENINRNDLLTQLKHRKWEKPITNQLYAKTSLEFEYLQNIKQIKVSRLVNNSHKVEGHVACTLFDRYVIIVGGWGPERANVLYAYDGAHLPTSLKELHVVTEHIPRFTYGFSAFVLPSHINLINHTNVASTTSNSMTVYSSTINSDIINHINPSQSSSSSSSSSSQSSLHNNDNNTMNNCSSRIVMYGGCQQGGYSGDCNNMYVIDVKARAYDPETHDYKQEYMSTTEFATLPKETLVEVNAKYNRMSTPSSMSSHSSSAAVYTPLTRGYHSAVMAKIRGKEMMLVWGGLHDEQPIASLESYDFETGTWTLESNINGTEPSPRFGHSMTKIDDTTFMLIGGSDGNDLLRNGDELRDVYTLTLHTCLSEDSPSSYITSFTWNEAPAVSSIYPPISQSAEDETQSQSSLVPGRCHTFIHTGDGTRNIVCFSGGANNSNNVTVLQYTKHDQPVLYDRLPATEYASEMKISDMTIDKLLPSFSLHSYRIYTPEVYSTAIDDVPVSRTSAVATRVGKYMIIQGGWSNEYRELGDMWLMDLGCTVSDQSITKSSLDHSTQEEGHVVTTSSSESNDISENNTTTKKKQKVLSSTDMRRWIRVNDRMRDKKPEENDRFVLNSDIEPTTMEQAFSAVESFRNYMNLLQSGVVIRPELAEQLIDFWNSSSLIMEGVPLGEGIEEEEEGDYADEDYIEVDDNEQEEEDDEEMYEDEDDEEVSDEEEQKDDEEEEVISMEIQKATNPNITTEEEKEEDLLHVESEDIILDEDEDDEDDDEEEGDDNENEEKC